MLTLRKFLRACYGYLAGFFLVASTDAVPLLIREYRHDIHRAALVPDIELWRAVLSAAVRLVIVTPVPLAIFFAMAWWNLCHGKSSGRAWAIAANTLLILISFPLCAAALFTSRFGRKVPPLAILWLTGTFLAIGLIGLLAFARRHPDSLAAMTQTKPVRVRGDGTSQLFDFLSFGIAIVSAIAGIDWCSHWGYIHHLPYSTISQWLLKLAGALLITTTVHETGHAGVGQVLGMKLRMFVVGPLQWRIRDGRWKFEFRLKQLFSAGGATALVPINPKQAKWIDITMIAAGPLANLVTGLAFMALMLTAPGRPYQSAWELCGLCGVLSLSSVLVNLIPFRPESIYSDGAQIYQLISGGPWADFRHAISVVLASAVTPLRPRDYDIAAIQRAESFFAHGYQAFVLRLIASSYYMDINDQLRARESLADAERIYAQSTVDLPEGTLLAVIFRVAFLRRDPIAARAWWERLEAKKPTHLGVDYWLARSALLWVEGNLVEAREAWEKGNVLAKELPAAGDYDFDRDRAAMLGRAINGAVSSSWSEA